jgi:acylphosphatase
MLVARRFVVSGRVQGVGFRFFAVEAAKREGLHGWVMNRADGCVEAQAEGDVAAVERFEREIRRGPPGSRVERVDVDDDVPAGRAAGFTIRRQDRAW